MTFESKIMAMDKDAWSNQNVKLKSSSYKYERIISCVKRVCDPKRLLI